MCVHIVLAIEKGFYVNWLHYIEGGVHIAIRFPQGQYWEEAVCCALYCIVSCMLDVRFNSGSKVDNTTYSTYTVTDNIWADVR